LARCQPCGNAVTEIDPRDFGHLEAQVVSLTELVKAQTVAMAVMAIRLDALNATLTEARGGWRMLMLLGGAAAALGSLIPWVISHLRFSP
jgi:hypothetical protein